VRIHCLGIGSASQDRFLAQLARHTGGVSRFLTPSERVDVPAVDLFASVGRPVAAAIAVKGATVLTDLPDSVFAGTPLVFFGEAEAHAEGALRVEWDAGHCDLPLPIGDSPLGETRLLADMESRVTSHAREEGRVEKRIEELSVAYGLASRRMALVAVVERAGDRPGDLPKTVVVPVGMARDTPFDAYFGAPPVMAAMAMMPPVPLLSAPAQTGADRGGSMLRALFSKTAKPGKTSAPPPPPAEEPKDTDDLLIELAARIQPDGGMPGASAQARMIATVMAVMWLLAEGNTLKRGAFRSHVGRLLAYLEGLGKPELEEVVKAVRKGKALPGNWRTGQPEDCPVLAKLNLI
jgi:hypothetical protein